MLTRLSLGDYKDYELLSEKDLSLFRHTCLLKSNILYTNNFRFVILKSGEAKLYYVDDSGNKEFILYFLKEGNMTMLDKHCVLESLSHCEMLDISIKDIKDIFNNKDFSMAMINSLIRTSSMQREVITDIMFGNLENKLLKFLYALSLEQNEVFRDRRIVTLPFSISVLSNLLGFERQSVSTCFNKLLKNGILQAYGKNRFVITRAV